MILMSPVDDFVQADPVRTYDDSTRKDLPVSSELRGLPATRSAGGESD